MLFLYVMGFFGVLIPLTYLSPHKSASEVFTVFQNLGGWSTMGVSFFVGFITVSGSFLGRLSHVFLAPEHLLIGLSRRCRWRRSYR